MSSTISSRWVLAVLSLTMAAACADPGLYTGRDSRGFDPRYGSPDIVVDPLLLAFGATSDSELERRTVSIENVGASPLDIYDVTLLAGEGFEVSVGWAARVDAGESTYFHVTLADPEAAASGGGECDVEGGDEGDVHEEAVGCACFLGASERDPGARGDA